MWYVSALEYYPAIKKNEIMLFVATWMDLEIVIFSEKVREGEIMVTLLICGI